MRSVCLVVFLVSCFLGPTSTQAKAINFPKKKVDSAQAQQWLKTSDSLYNASEYEKAINFFQKTKKALQETGQKKDYYYAINSLAMALAQQQEFKKAETHLEKIVNELKDQPNLFPEQLGKAYNSLGFIYNNAAEMRDPNKVEAFYNNAISAFKKADESDKNNLKMVYGNLSAFYYQNGQIDKALDYAKKAATFPVDSARTINNAQACNMLAEIYKHKGDIKKALELHEASLSIFQAKKGESYYGTGVLYLNIGRIYLKRRNLIEAKDYINKARNILGDALGEHPKTAQCLGNLALIDEWYGNRKEALEKLDKAKAIYDKMGVKESDSYLNLLYSIGRNYTHLGQYQKAFDFYHKIFQQKQNFTGGRNYYILHLANTYRKVGKLDSALYYLTRLKDSIIDTRGRNHYATVNVYLHLAKTYKDKENYNLALENIQKALGSCFNEFQWDTYYDNPTLGDNERWDIVFKVLNQKGQILKNLAQTKKRVDTTNLKHAHRNFYLATQLIDTIKDRYRSRKTVHNVYNLADNAYENAIQTAFDLYEITGKSHYKEKAYPLFANSKSVLLRKNLEKSKAQQFANIPDSLVGKEKELQEDISYFQSKLHHDKNNRLDSSQRAAFKKRLISKREEFRSLKERLQTNYPDYYRLMYNSNVLTIQDLQEQALTQNECVLEYFSGEDAYYYTFIANDTSIIGTVKKDSAFQQSLNNVLQAINNPDAKVSDFLPPSYNLYQSLLGTISYPIEDMEINIIPDGQLVYLPFEVLVKKKPEKEEAHFNTLQYSVYDYSINYVYANTFLQKNRRGQTGNLVKYLAIAPSFNKKQDTTENEEVSQLRGAKQELQYVSLIGEGDTLKGQKATEKNFKDQTKDREILHLATHAFIETKYPMKSRLLLAKSDTSSEDGKLYAWELFNMDMDAELAVLSACNTGRGKMVKGEGVMSLGRAFSYAGCHSLLISLWNVHDQVSVGLMEQFYRSLDKGMAKDEALRQSKLDYLASADGITAHPYYWAGMITMGDASPIKEDAFLSGTKIFYSLMTMIIVIFVGGFIYYRKGS